MARSLICGALLNAAVSGDDRHELYRREGASSHESVDARSNWIGWTETGIARSKHSRERKNGMAIQTIEVQRFSLTTSRSFEAVVASLKAGVGRLDLAAFASASKSPGTFTELEEVINRDMGKTHLMLFLEFDHGAVLRKETGLNKPKMVRLVIGNPLVMKEMAKHVPDAGSYAPVTVLVDEREDGIHLSYDKMVSFLTPYGNQEALTVAHDLDQKIVKLLNDAAVE